MRSHKKITMIWLPVLALMLLITACGAKSGSGSATSTSITSAQDDKITIGFAVPDMTNPFFIQQIDALKKMLGEQGAELMVAGADNNLNKQIGNIENMVASKVDVIIVAAVEPKGIESSLKSAREAGVKVFSFGQDQENADAVIMSDNKMIGRKLGENAAKWINEKLGGNAEVGMIVSTGVPIMADRTAAMEEAIRTNAPGAKIVAKQEAVTTADAQKVAENILLANPKLQVIATISDQMGLGAYEAVKGAGRASDMFYINGSDATPEGIAKLKEGGVFRATLDFGTKFVPQMTVDSVMKLAKGEQIDKYIYTQISIVDASNVNQY
ncbi:sugar ABC transporter substrate-binding protein [Paenibacillus zanthoxyli]|uniref:sugar ABC transporter substrate-binding protein n=1 Tax=Paenibacillus zanthoxyli TaxID=369399 RepID=UPI00047027E0|nr:sugar ABC transporter substrate-binding protein [Paenibacillus zanthoxyli]